MSDSSLTKELLDLLRFRRLDSRNGFASGDDNTVQLMAAAADEIERLRTANAQMLEHGREMWADVERLRAALAGMIEGVRSIEVSGDDWQEHIGDRLARAYKAVGPGLLPQEIAALEGAQDEPGEQRMFAGPTPIHHHHFVHLGAPEPSRHAPGVIAEARCACGMEVCFPPSDHP